LASNSVVAFKSALSEVHDLRLALSKISAQRHKRLEIERAIGRAQVVLLASHLERYVRAVNEEAALALSSGGAKYSAIGLPIKLLHAREAVDRMAQREWSSRESDLQAFFASEAWLWGYHDGGAIEHDRLLNWMRTPKPEALRRYFRYWGIEDIFSLITRTKQSRDRLWLGLQELADKRNNIAHGDSAAVATQGDIRRLESVTTDFCVRADKRLATAIAAILDAPRPW
jgi:hypothetical protein